MTRTHDYLYITDFIKFELVKYKIINLKYAYSYNVVYVCFNATLSEK